MNWYKISRAARNENGTRRNFLKALRQQTDAKLWHLLYCQIKVHLPLYMYRRSKRIENASSMFKQKFISNRVDESLIWYAGQGLRYEENKQKIGGV
jgi:hypothetical protein